MPYGSEGQRYFESTRVSRSTGDNEPHFSEDSERHFDLRSLLSTLLQHTPLRRFVKQPDQTPQGPQNTQQ